VSSLLFLITTPSGAFLQPAGALLVLANSLFPAGETSYRTLLSQSQQLFFIFFIFFCIKYLTVCFLNLIFTILFYVPL
ncbi:MAG: hypothetical protein J6J35_04005, partial [Alphaproteobacteria bacterium]|nr:hypothetical protein [Alphaproteobacteria bacterium]